ncbi:hypothetical protein L5G32_12595 [Gordonia sp. HY002]|uniref:hypothetical protein n=1 Tax=Gordonia zhenghanii TaxID=2911516 RepID=UPI001EEF8E0B|nr:hypothetical protein [Gordonia zhenghanii]MCF8571107.1 hypothetical protein [Gordonia zhenghanii]MCF8604685.1 hypothetical protein [Gordonia zhenghanii]
MPPQQFAPQRPPQYAPYPQNFQYPQNSYPPLPPRKSRTGWVLAGVAVIAVAVVGVVLLVVAPWSSDGPDGPQHETVALDHGVSADVDVPAGWRIETGDFNGSMSLMLVPESDTRSISQVDDDGDAMDDGKDADPIHAMIGLADTCGTEFRDLTAGQWRPDSGHQTDDGAETYRHSAVTRVDSTYCFQLVGIDFGRSTSTIESTASDLTKKLVADESITAAKAA